MNYLYLSIFLSIKSIKGIMKLTFMPTVHHTYVRQNINFIYKLEGKVRNNLKKLPINNISIPICNNPLAIHRKPRFLMFL